MQVMYEGCAGLGMHKETMVCAMMSGAKMMAAKPP
jgi:hypothetical protein